METNSPPRAPPSPLSPQVMHILLVVITFLACFSNKLGHYRRARGPPCGAAATSPRSRPFLTRPHPSPPHPTPTPRP